MNRIFKVIWSKTKHCYIVVSEYAKANTKAVHTGLRTTAAAAAVAAMLLAPVNYNYAWAADTVTVEEADTSTTTQQTQTVYTTDGADKTFATKADAAVQDAGVVKADKKIGENVTALGKGLYDETAARIGADAAQDKVIQKVNENLVQSVNTINKNVADGFTALNTADANEAKARTDADAAEKAAREVGDTTLDTRITKVKEYLENQTSENYVSKTDAAVQDGAIVKADKTIGENVTNLDAALAKETADRIGADAAQDKVIQQVNENAAAGIKTLTEAYNNEVAARQSADTNLQTNIDNEAAARKAADGKLVDAVNSGLSLSNDNVLQKNTTAIDDQGNVTTSKTAANEMILNKDGDNRITLSDKGIKVGLNSTVQDFKGFYAGGDNAEAAKAALNAGGSIKGANGAFTVDVNGNVTSTTTITGKTVTDGKGASMTDGTVTGKTLTDGIATITNGNISTSGTVTGGTVTSTGNISALGDIHAGGAITGASASIQSALTAGSATITGDLTAGGAIQGKSISDGTATMQNGNITGVKNLSAETITTSGDATIGGDLTVNGKLNVDEIDLTKNGIVDGNNVTASTEVAAGEITSYKKVAITKDGSEKESAIDYDENGTSTWAKATDADGNWNKSTLIVEGNDVKSKVVDSERNSNLSTQTSTQSQSTLTDKDSNTNVSTQTVSESSSVVSGKDGEKTYKSYITQNMKKILQGIKEGSNESTVDQTETGIKSTATDGKNTASTNLSNKGFNTYATDGTNKTYTLQTAESLTSQIGDDGKVKSVMNADGITNNADGGTITNSAKELVNTATGNMTNTVGGKLLNDVTGDMENKVGGNLTTTVSGTSTETVTGKKTETYNDGLETTVTGEEKHTVNGSQTNTIGGSQTTTVTGDSSLTAENITNEAKNKITNKALDVETDATSSIVQKVTNAAGSNTSTQLSYQTTEEMKAGGKTASYLRGAAEEKSQLINGSEKTTIDTIAGQTNSNITDGTNTSNDLQKADQIASSVTDGTNTTVVNQNAGSLASSITDGTKVNNSSNTVDKSEQLIKASDTQYSATSKTATKMEDALVSGSSVIDVTKNLDDAANPFIGSAVTDGTNSTGVTQTAKDITNTAKNGTIANEAKDITNNATENMTNTVGKDLTTTVGGNQTTTVTGDSSLTAKNIHNTANEALTNDAKTITNTASESVTTQIGDGSAVKSVMNGDGIANTATGKAITNDAATITNTGTTSVTNQVGNNKVLVDTEKVQSAFGDTIYTTWNANGITNNATDKTVATTARDIQNTATGDITNTASAGTITNDAKTLLNKASESITDKVGENVERTMTTKKISESVNDGTKSNSFSKTAEKDINIITDGTKTSTLSQLADSVNTSLKNGTQSLNNKKTVTEDVTKVTDENTGAFSSSSQKADAMTNTVKNGSKSNTVTETASTSGQKLVSKNIIDILKDAENGYVNTTVSNSDGSSSTGVKQTYTDITSTAEQGTITNDAKNLVNKAEEKLSNSAAEIENTATSSIKDTVGKSTVTTTTDGTTFENTDHNGAIGDGSITKTTISGNTLKTSKATMDYAEVMKDLRVGGTTTTKDLHVTNNATIDGTLGVTGAANFQDTVTVAGDVTAQSYKVGDKTYIDENGINANNQKITNVAAGTEDSDAANYGQLRKVETRVDGVENRVTNVENRVDKMDSRIDKVGANAAAMANLHPLEFDEDSKWNVAAAVGNYKGETAAAVGAFYRPNEDVMFNLSTTFGNDENMVGGGLSLRLGKGGNREKDKKLKAAIAENNDLRAKVDDLTARMDALLSVINPNMSKEFPDVPENHWAYEAVTRLAGNDIVQGYEDGKFHGERTMTRYEMAELIYNALSRGAKAEKKLVEEFKPELQAMAAQKQAK